MQNAAVERLAKIISDREEVREVGGKGFRPRRPVLHFRLGLAEGWFSLVLLAIVVYSTTLSVQMAGWVHNLNVLSLTSIVGLLVGVAAAKQRRFPRLALHGAVVIFAILLAFWQTTGAFYHGDANAFVHGVQEWYKKVSFGGTGDTDAIFLFLILMLGFVLAYTSAWLVYRTRAPWLMIVANAVVLLINLNNAQPGLIVFLVVFLLASLLLLLRFNLYESMRRWKKMGLRYADDIGWDVMQAGALISIGLLVFSWVLPNGYIDPLASQVWNSDVNPVTSMVNVWNRVISVNGGANPANHGSFSARLTLGGNPNLTTDPVFYVTNLSNNSAAISQYLMAFEYENYSTAGGWELGPTQNYAWKENAFFGSTSQVTAQVKLRLKVINAPGGSAVLFGPSDIAQVNLPINIQYSPITGQTVAWVSRNGQLTNGTEYDVTSQISAAPIDTLKTIMPPDKATPYVTSGNPNEEQPIGAYDPQILKTYKQLPGDLDPRIRQLAQQLTRDKTNLYDMMAALESYLHNHYEYSVDVSRDTSQDGVSWFLFDSKKGYCNYFASAMAVMARSLGVPARVVSGYTSPKYDAKLQKWKVIGTDAHAWTQIYFAGYGWINFEPSASFANYTRPLPSSSATPTVPGGSGGSGTDPSEQAKLNRFHNIDPNDVGGGGSVGDPIVELRQQVGIASGTLLLLLLFASILFVIWWRQLFRKYSLASQIYGRVCVMANWAGIKVEPWQTPYETVEQLAVIVPAEAERIERLGDIYVRERWADPKSKEHPSHSGEVSELAGLWKILQPRIFFYVARHPYFLRWVPQYVGQFFSRMRQKRRAMRLEDEEI